MTIVLTCENFQISVTHRCTHPRNPLIDRLEAVAELIEKLVSKDAKLSNRELRELGHIRKSTRRSRNKC